MHPIYVANKATRVKDLEIEIATQLCSFQLQHHIAPAWGRVPVPVYFTSNPDAAPAGSWVIVVMDSSDQAEELGFHSEDAQGRIYGRVFAGPVLDNGGDVLTKELSVASVLSHEIAESFIDSRCDAWWQAADGTLYAAELCMAAGTSVQLADGSEAAIESLARVGGWHDVLAADDDGRTVKARGLARKTGRQKVVRVQLTDGSSFTCTPDHRILIGDGTYVEAQNLDSGNALLPSLPASSAVDCTKSNAVLLSEDPSWFSAPADLGYSGVGELRDSDLFTEQVPISLHATFDHGIRHVETMSSRENVIGIQTPRVVASVASGKTFGKRAIDQFPREAVSPNNLAFLTDLPVPRRITRTHPNPTSIRAVFIDSGPKAIDKGRASVVIGLETRGRIRGAVPLHSLPMSGAKPFSSQRSRAVFNSAISHAKTVAAVEDAGIADVYDVTVPELHNFAIGAGVFVHNCDPVEDASYVVSNGNVSATLSNFILPAWADQNAPEGTMFDYLHQLKAPFTISSGAYCIKQTGGTVSQQFGENYPSWKTDLKKSELARTARRMRQSKD